MTAWVVTENWSEEKKEPVFDHNRIAGVFTSEEKARELQEELINQNAVELTNGTEEPIDVTIDECELQ